MRRVLVVGGFARSLTLFRGSLLRDLVCSGARVTACAAEDDLDVRRELAAIQVEYQAVRLHRASVGFINDLVYFRDLVALILRVKPDTILCYTHKPVVFGSLAATMCRVPKCYAMITGLGYAFSGDPSLRQRVVRAMMRVLYRIALRRNAGVIFHNPDDRAELLQRGFIPRRVPTVLVRGSGVDLQRFRPSPPTQDPPAFLLVARLLRDKGIVEYADAARSVRIRHPKARFHLVGPPDPNPSALPAQLVEEWSRSELLLYHGETADVRPFLDTCSAYVLPSYREGTPRTVLEAMSVGRAIITTDVPGCRETVQLTTKGQRERAEGAAVMEGENGFLVRPRDAGAVAAAMHAFLDNPTLAGSMGRRSREIAEQKYDVNIVNAAMLEAIGQPLVREFGK